MRKNSWQIEEALQKHGFIKIGKGAFSAAFAKPGSDRIIKVNRCEDSWLNYILWAARLGYAGRFAPKVYSFHRFTERNGDPVYIAIAERLHSRIYDLRNLPVYSTFCEWQGWAFRVHNEFQRGRTPAERLNPKIEAAFPGIEQFTFILVRRYSGIDLNEGNIMFRSNGSWVINDPVTTGDTDAPYRMREHELSPFHWN